MSSTFDPLTGARIHDDAQPEQPAPLTPAASVRARAGLFWVYAVICVTIVIFLLAACGARTYSQTCTTTISSSPTGAVSQTVCR